VWGRSNELPFPDVLQRDALRSVLQLSFGANPSEKAVPRQQHAPFGALLKGTQIAFARPMDNRSPRIILVHKPDAEGYLFPELSKVVQRSRIQHNAPHR